MADHEGQEVVKVKDLEKEITCAICHEHYTEPKVLPCCHYYCKQCLHQLTLKTGRDQPFSCPECRKETILPEGGVEQLPTAFFVNRMKEIHSKLERVLGKAETKCEICQEDKAEAFCRQCTKFLCNACVKAHRQLQPIFPGHNMSTLEELRENVAKEIFLKEPTYQSCRVHKQPMNMYCFDCKQLICRDGPIKDHFGHKFEFLKVAATKIKEELTQQLKPLRELATDKLRRKVMVQTTSSEVEAQRQPAFRKIETFIEQLHTILEELKQKLIKDTNVEIDRKMKLLSEQEECLSLMACAAIQSVIDYAEQCMEHAADDELLFMQFDIQSRIDRVLQEQQKALMEPVEEADLAVDLSCVEEVKQLCQTKAKVTRLPIQYTLTGRGLKSAELNRISQFQLSACNLFDGKPITCSTLIKSNLKSLTTGFTTNCHVEAAKDEEYHIQYTPTVRGLHELTVTVNGREVAGSPFSVLVHMPPTLLGKEPLQVFTGLQFPRDIAVNTAGDVIVAGSSSVVMLSANGIQLHLDMSQHGMADLFGVAVDTTDGCIFIGGTNSIIKLSPDFKMRAKYTGSDYGRMTVAGDILIVCDYIGKVVTVFTKDLMLVRKIGFFSGPSAPIGTLRNVCSDEEGHLYVSDWDRQCIHVLSKTGELQHSFGQGMLKNPVGVCVTGQHVYVANCNRHCVCVFTTEGKYVTSFGQCGRSVGNFDHPAGMCMDKHGFLYVCDYHNKRVQKF